MSWKMFQVAAQREGFPPEQIPKIWRAFDTDRSGWLSLREICPKSHRLLRHFKEHCMECYGSVSKALPYFDDNGNGVLGRWEFIRHVCGPLCLPSDEEKYLFNGLDKDGSKEVHLSEILFLDSWDLERERQDEAFWNMLSASFQHLASSSPANRGSPSERTSDQDAGVRSSRGKRRAVPLLGNSALFISDLVDPTATADEGWAEGLPEATQDCLSTEPALSDSELALLRSPLKLEQFLAKHHVDVSLFGKGKAKSMQDIWEEFKLKQCTFHVDEDGKLLRRVRVLKLRFVTNHPAFDSLLTLVMVARKSSTFYREELEPPRLPSKIMSDGETIESAVERLAADEAKISRSFLDAHVTAEFYPADCSAVCEWEETCNSKGYPGMTTIYALTEVHLRLNNPKDLHFHLGCPKMSDFESIETQRLRTLTYYWSWRPGIEYPGHKCRKTIGVPRRTVSKNLFPG